MNLLLALLTVWTAALAHAQDPSPHDRRFRELAATFPRAFAPYTHVEYLMLTDTPVWFDDDAGQPILLIPARVTELGEAGRAAGARQSYIRASVAHSPKDQTVNLLPHEISATFSGPYAWRVLFAEILIRYPETKRLWIGSTSQDGDHGLGFCSDLLARGMARTEAAVSHPAVAAARAFEFHVVDTLVQRSAEDGGASEYAPNELELSLWFELGSAH